jgi:hypothetical protein
MTQLSELIETQTPSAHLSALLLKLSFPIPENLFIKLPAHSIPITNSPLSLHNPPHLPLPSHHILPSAAALAAVFSVANRMYRLMRARACLWNHMFSQNSDKRLSEPWKFGEVVTGEPGMITLVARDRLFQVVSSGSDIVSRAVMGGFGPKYGEIVGCVYRGDIEMRSGGREMGLAKFEAVSSEGKSMIDG